MENKKIAYVEKGTLCIITPVDDCGLTIEEIAAKDVPAGVPYFIIGDGFLPSDRSLREEWSLPSESMVHPDGFGVTIEESHAMVDHRR